MSKSTKTLITILAILLLGGCLYDAMHAGLPTTTLDVILKIAVGATGAVLGWTLMRSIKHDSE